MAAFFLLISMMKAHIAKKTALLRTKYIQKKQRKIDVLDTLQSKRSADSVLNDRIMPENVEDFLENLPCRTGMFKCEENPKYTFMWQIRSCMKRDSLYGDTREFCWSFCVKIGSKVKVVW